MTHQIDTHHTTRSRFFHSARTEAAFKPARGGIAECSSDIRSLAGEAVPSECCNTCCEKITAFFEPLLAIGRKIYSTFYNIYRAIRLFERAYSHQNTEGGEAGLRQARLRRDELRELRVSLMSRPVRIMEVRIAFAALSDDTRSLLYDITASSITQENLSELSFVLDWLSEIDIVLQFQQLFYSDLDVESPVTGYPTPTEEPARPAIARVVFQENTARPAPPPRAVPPTARPVPARAVPPTARPAAPQLPVAGREPTDEQIAAFKSLSSQQKIDFLKKMSVAHQIVIMRECLPENVQIPEGFECPLQVSIYADPVRDVERQEGGGRVGGHLFDKEWILTALAQVSTPCCPSGRERLDVDRVWVREEGNGEYGARAVWKVTNYQRALKHDHDLQKRIHCWLKQQLGLNY